MKPDTVFLRSEGKSNRLRLSSSFPARATIHVPVCRQEAHRRLTRVFLAVKQHQPIRLTPNTEDSFGDL
jgi:hypothetical protein